MRLSLKNVGIVAQADIELNGITVIAGENATGKSTVSRALFCAFNSLYQKDQKVFRARRNSLERGLEYFLEKIYFDKNKDILFLKKREKIKTWSGEIEKFIEILIKNRDIYLNNKDLLKKDILNFYLQSKTEFGKQDEEKVEDINFKDSLNFATERIFIFISISDEEIFLMLSEKIFKSEFYNQINNIDHPKENAEINLSINGKNIEFCINNNELKNVKGSFCLSTKVFYLDNFFVLSAMNHQQMFISDIFSNYQFDLLRALKQKNTESVVEEIVAKKKISSIIEKLNKVFNGEIVVIKGGEYVFKRKNSDAFLNINNISAGHKAFVVLKTLLMNGSLKENGTLILDEPEINMHPALQIVYAELIVLIQKEFGMHILLNTHSPYFVDAMEVYTVLHGIADKCRYYLAENSENGAVFKDVSNSINEIYKKLASPFQDLEDARYPND